MTVRTKIENTVIAVMLIVVGLPAAIAAVQAIAN